MDLILNVKNNKNVSKHFILNEGINENLHCVVNINFWSDVFILLNTLLFHFTCNLYFGHISKYLAPNLVKSVISYLIFDTKSIQSGGQGQAHVFFLPLLFGAHFLKILSWKNFWFPKFPFLGIGLGLYHVGPHQVEFPSLKPLEPESIFSKWSKSLYSGLEFKSSSWGPSFGLRLKLYMLSNTPRWVGLVIVLNRKSAKSFGGLFSPVLELSNDISFVSEFYLEGG